MEDAINIHIQQEDGSRLSLEAPTDMGLTVMEFLKASELDIPAICGGMAICATCHVEILESNLLPEPNDDEAFMLDSLPHATSASRLSCQLRITPELDGLVVRLAPDA